MTDDNSNDNQNFLYHLGELRSRIIFCLIFFLVFSLIIFSKSVFLIDIAQEEFKKNFSSISLIGKSPIDAFMIRIKVSIFIALFLSLPFILYEAWAFIKTGLRENEKKYSLIFLLSGSLLGIIGALFCHFYILPLALKFFYSQYNLLSLNPMIHFDEYVSFFIKLDLTFALVFELPIIFFILAKLGLINSKVLTKYARQAILIIVIIAAFLTPPDAVTQVLMAFPLVVLYYVSVYIVKLVEKKEK